MAYYCNDIYYLGYFSNKLKQMIKKKGITQKHLAEQTGAGQTTISRYVNAQGLPGYNMLYRLAEALDCSVNEFFPER